MLLKFKDNLSIRPGNKLYISGHKHLGQLFWFSAEAFQLTP